MPYTKAHMTAGRRFETDSIIINTNAASRALQAYGTPNLTNPTAGSVQWDTTFGLQNAIAHEQLITDAAFELLKHTNALSKHYVGSSAAAATTSQITVSLVRGLKVYNGLFWETRGGVARNISESNAQGGAIQKQVDILINLDQGQTMQKGSYGFELVMHELGHALGLYTTESGKDHPHEIAPNDNYTRDNTIMSYTKGTGVNSNPLHAHTPMMYDIAGLQDLYGPNTQRTAGDDIYTITGTQKAWTIWDSGGNNDKLDISTALDVSKGAVIDLRGGADDANDVRFSLIGKERIAIGLNPASNWQHPIEIEHATGHDGNDVMLGNDGNNSLVGGKGIDTLIGGAGRDMLKGGDDADLISDSWWNTFDTSLKTDGSNDSLYGEGGNDELVSYDGTDYLDGGAGNDIFYGLGSASGTMTGGSGNNTYSIASNGSYTINGGTGDDYINIYGGSATIYGGGGETHVSMNPEEYVEIHGGDGTLNIGTDGVRGTFFHLSESTTPFVPPDLWVDTDTSDDGDFYLLGGSWRAFKAGSYLDIWRDGGNGITARIFGWQEGNYGIELRDYYVEGNVGTFNTTPLETVPYGLPLGDDHLYFGAYEQTVDILGFTEDSVKQRLGSKAVSGTSQADTINFSSDYGEQTIQALKGDDSITGSSGDNTIEGGEGNDTISGIAGDDLLDGGEGRDSLSGGDGSDMFRFAEVLHSPWGWVDTITDFTSSDKIDLSNLPVNSFVKSSVDSAFGQIRAVVWNGDTYITNHQLGFEVKLQGNVLSQLSLDNFIFNSQTIMHGTSTNNTINGSANAERIVGYAGNDSLHGQAGNDTIWGGDGVDIIVGGSGVDSMMGDAGADQLYGDWGNDIMLGGDGNDLLDGGQERDVMTGGAGSDTFRFWSASHSPLGWVDRITDFGAGDRIDLSNLPGITSVRFGSGNSAAGEVRVVVWNDGTTTDTYITSHQLGFEVRLDGNVLSELTASDFIF